MRLAVLLLTSSILFGQSHTLKLYDAQSPAHYMTITAPDTLSLNPAPIIFSGKSGALLVGMDTTDASVLAGAVVSANSFVSATAATNAAIGSFGAVSGSYVAVSSSKTGSASYLPMAFFTGGSERIRILTGGNVGINTATPGYTLDVNGDLNISGVCHGCGAGASQWITSGSDIYYNTGNVGIGTTNPITFNGGVGRVLNLNAASGGMDLHLSTSAGPGGFGAFNVSDLTATAGDPRMGQLIFIRIADVTAGRVSSNAQLYVNNDGGMVAALRFDRLGHAFFWDEVSAGGAISSTVGFASSNSASNTVNVPNGGGLFNNLTVGTTVSFAVGAGLLTYDGSSNVFIDSTHGIALAPGGGASALFVSSAGHTLAGATSDDGSGATLQTPGFVSAATGYYSAGTAYDTFKALSGGIATDNATFSNNSSSPTVTARNAGAGYALDAYGSLLINHGLSGQIALNSSQWLPATDNVIDLGASGQTFKHGFIHVLDIADSSISGSIFTVSANNTNQAVSILNSGSGFGIKDTSTNGSQFHLIDIPSGGVLNLDSGSGASISSSAFNIASGGSVNFQSGSTALFASGSTMTANSAFTTYGGYANGGANLLPPVVYTYHSGAGQTGSLTVAATVNGSAAPAGVYRVTVHVPCVQTGSPSGILVLAVHYSLGGSNIQTGGLSMGACNSINTTQTWMFRSDNTLALAGGTQNIEVQSTVTSRVNWTYDVYWTVEKMPF